jgi:hypothetical protein
LNFELFRLYEHNRLYEYKGSMFNVQSSRGKCRVEGWWRRSWGEERAPQSWRSSCGDLSLRDT